jgi:membrane-associated phospholipid phosphatase
LSFNKLDGTKQMKNALFIFFHIGLLNIAFTQSNTYKLSWQKDAWLLTGGMGLVATGYVLHANADRATVSDINGLNKNDVRAFDRSAIDNNSAFAQTASDVLLFSSLALPLTAFLSQKGKAERWAIPIMCVEAYSYTAGITVIMKSTFKRFRPFSYNTALSLDTRTNVSARESFPSGHVSATAVATFFTAKVLTDMYPQIRLKPLIWTAAAVIPATTGFFRYKAGKHFPTDVIVGYALGASIGYVIPAIHKLKNVSLGIAPTGQAQFSLIF